MITAAFAVALLAIALCVFALYHLRAESKLVRERENEADQHDQALWRRETDLARREYALRWAGRGPQWVQR